ncbi:glycosyltransferase family 2 protein [Prevotella sp. HUN102]|uniref:glycosyltransferase family 2 protein n=1 Tax=Prevotella sp. HUN102 TaxID=1392486 RepID=UPI00048B8E4F|nr:glycosyltransferase family 2 protein [Prevotella sp. HUN102]
MKTAIVILNWNGRHMLEKYLPTVIQHSPEADVIVADNASTDNSISWLRENHPSVRIIQLDKNYGFAGGYNKALEQVESEYYLLLNSDVEVTPGWLKPLLEKMEADKEIAACQPKLLSIYNKESFEYAGASGGHLDKYGYPFCRGRIFDTLEEDKGQYDNDEEIFWATGACLLIRSSAYREAGGLDERFFAHNEEIDLCWRLHQKGGKVYCFPQSKVYHLGGGTLPKSNPRKTFLNFRNNLTMLWKNLPEEDLKKVMRTRLFLDYLAAFQMLILQRNYKDFRAVIEGRRAFRKWRKDFKRVKGNKVSLNDKRKNYSILWQYYAKKCKYYSDIN